MRPVLWQTYVSPSGRFVMKWRLGFIWQRTDGRLRSVRFMRWRIWEAA
jgi:hypothetical protein